MRSGFLRIFFFTVIMEYYKNLDLSDIVYFCEVDLIEKTEQWKDIPDYVCLYQVSDLGRVKSLKRATLPSDKIVKLQTIEFRLKTKLFNKENKQGKHFSIHQLVAMAFLNHRPCGLKLVVDHIDNNPLNNMLNNLQIITNRENCSKDRLSNSGFTGVEKIGDRFRSRILINKIKIYLGTYATAKEASDVYVLALNKSLLNEDVNALKKVKEKPRESGLKNIYYHQNKFRVRIYVNKKQINLGSYNSIIEAKQIRDSFIDNINS